MKLLRLLSLFALLAMGVSCNFTEEIRIQPDGSGSMSLRFDGSEMMAMTEAMDSLPGAAMDSVIYFSDILDEKKDSISRLSAEEQQRLEKLRPYRMHIQSDLEEASLLFTLARDFGQISEMGDALLLFRMPAPWTAMPVPGGRTPQKISTPLRKWPLVLTTGGFPGGPP